MLEWSVVPGLGLILILGPVLAHRLGPLSRWTRVRASCVSVDKGELRVAFGPPSAEVA